MLSGQIFEVGFAVKAMLLRVGKTAADVAIEKADIILISDEIGKIPQIIKVERRTINLIKQNIRIALMINVVGILLATNGAINPLIAAAIHEGNALFVVLNCARLNWAKYQPSEGFSSTFSSLHPTEKRFTS